jgi:DMSO/TMAO reductase YedYZ molybdopterin-dependent catalytic subunit
MRVRNSPSRRRFLGGALSAACAALLSGCDALSKTQWFPKILDTAEHLNRTAQGLITSRKSTAQEFTEADLSPEFRSNGTDYPDGPEYRAHAEAEFANWALRVDGLVNRPSDFSLAQLRAMRSRTQITRHDCVEGWSAIGKWTGVPLSEVLAAVQPHPQARYVVFYCADTMDDGARYYESVDLDDAYHPQTILAYGLNGKPLPIANGAPLRVRIERQLGYKMAKYIMRIELVDTFRTIADGGGGYWEDRGYEWYAGI